MGSGRVDLTRAADAGLVLDETEADYLGADPALGGDVTELNLASMADSDCRGTCTWTRTVTATETGAGSWTAQGAGLTDGIEVTVAPASFTLAAGGTQQLTITADVVGAPTGDLPARHRHPDARRRLHGAGGAPARRRAARDRLLGRWLGRHPYPT